MPATLTFHSSTTSLPKDVQTLAIIGRAQQLLSDSVAELIPAAVPKAAWDDMVKRNDPGDGGRTVDTHTGGKPSKVVAGILPELCSRHNSPTRAWAIPRCVRGAGLRGDVVIVLALESEEHALAATLAVAQSHPTYAGHARTIERDVHILLLGPEGPIEDTEPYEIAAEARRRAAHLVDSPPNVVNCDAMVQAAQDVVRRNPGKGLSIMVLRGHELESQGFGGIYNVGKAGIEAPALVVLDYAPEGATTQHCWVGKGVVYDTGGLSIKSKTGMPSMKTDMGGAGAMLAAFEAVVRLGSPHKLSVALCIAENAVGPQALRPDDVITMYSGRTVEINNTDAEGRLCLADGVAWMVRHREPDLLVDMATLTGAQAMATGKLHGALYCNDEELENKAVAVGRRSGDMVHPLPYAPELYKKEFSSHIADMRNSVKDRSNAQSSCAGQFVGNHIRKYKNPWLHVDMAAPAKSHGRATGWGVGLLIQLADCDV